jgi:hypothetical protein
MRRVSELKLTDCDGISIRLHDSRVGLCVTVEYGDKESREVCLLPHQRRQLVVFLIEAGRDSECRAGGDCAVHPSVGSQHNPDIETDGAS